MSREKRTPDTRGERGSVSMLEALHIETLRGIRNLDLRDFQAVNLLVGDNDVGKTTVLEAIKLFGRPDDIPSILRASRMRIMNRMPTGRGYYSPFDTFLHLFSFSNNALKIDISMMFDGKKHSLRISGEIGRTLTTGTGYNHASYTLRESGVEQEVDTFWGELSFDDYSQPIELREDVAYNVAVKAKPYVRIEYIAPGQHLNGVNRNVFRSKVWEQETVNALRIIDPDIEGIKLVPNEYGTSNNTVVEHKQHGEVPLYACGDGLKRVFTLASILPAAKGGILMIDEVETSLQAKHLPVIFDWLLSASRDYGIQLFITTHSAEAISAMARCAYVHPSELACYRLEKFRETIRARRFSERKLESLVNGSGFDVR